MKSAIIFGSSTGMTESVAQDLGALLKTDLVFNCSDVAEGDIEGVDLLILGASTWGIGDLQDDMADFLGTLAGWSCRIPFGAVFGLGDQETYPDSYVDGIADMYETLTSRCNKIIGSWSADGYTHTESRAQEGDHFLGLALDQDNEADRTEERLEKWITLLKEAIG